MTKSTITREQLLEIIETDHVQCGEASYLARMVLAAMDGEPVAWTWHYREQWHVTNDKCRAEFVAKDGDVAVLPLYRHAQPVLEYPEVLPCSVLLEPGLRFGKGIKTSTVLAALARRAVYESDMAELSPEERAEFQAGIEDFKALIAQPAPVVPEKCPAEIRDLLASHTDALFNDDDAQEIWNACRAAMLQELKKSAGSEATCRSNENAQVLTSINPAPALVSLPKNAKSLTGNSPAIPDCWCRTCRPVDLNDMRFVVCPDCGNKRCPRANDHRNACTGSNEPGQEGSAYPDTPQLPGSEPATMPGKWIPVSERMPEVGDIVLTAMGGAVNVGEMECSAANCRFFTSVISGRELPATHWMPLPAAPQEDINALIPLVSRNDQEVK